MRSDYSKKYSTSRAFSMMEIVVVVAVMGILTAIAIPHIGSTLKSSQDVVATEVRETLNLALKKHSQVNYEFVLAADNASTNDEFAVVRSLQWRDPADPAMGSPFLRPNWDPVASSSTEDYRLRWSGRIFDVIEPGDAGSGIKVDFEAGDYGGNYTFPNDFTPVGG